MHEVFEMSTIQTPLVYDDLIDLLAEVALPEKLLSYRLSQEKQQRLDDLLNKNRDGTLSAEESIELDVFEHVEHVVRLLKAKVRSRQQQ
jgi:hypothetical protein